MRSSRVFHAVDSHTEGMPTRVITGGVGVVPGATMFDRRRYFIEHLDHIRTFLMNEPRGHAAMSGAILQPPTRPDADYGVLYIETSGCLPMCGHGTIGVATVLVETGMVEVTEPVTTIRLDTPAGLVVARVRVTDGAAKSVVLRNVPSFALGLDRTVRAEPWGDVPYDLAFGGNFYAIVHLDKLGIPFARTEKRRILDAGLAIMAAVNDQDRPVHPLNPEINAATMCIWPPPGRTRGTPGTPWSSTRACSTARPAAPAPAPVWPSCMPVANSPSTPTSTTSPSSVRTSPAASSKRASSGGRRRLAA
ncbi:4-hydroxyproline epimerase [Streptomyces sp. L-9-10]|nr:4-hydroxyproline epimerase [Streptomyces sp. L-9-10]